MSKFPLGQLQFYIFAEIVFGVRCTLNVMQVKLFLLRFICVIFPSTNNTDIWQGIIVQATESQKNCSNSAELKNLFSTST